MSEAEHEKQGASDAALLLSAEWRSDRMGARAKVVRAFELASGNAVKAAGLLGIGHRTILRYLKDAGVKDEVKKIRDRQKKATAQ